MNNDAPALLEDHKEKKIPFFEVVNVEKLWWALMLSKGLLNKDVQDLYRKARAGYENIILNDHDVVELQEVEYSLWKLHYKHIDEYRKRIRPTSANGTNMQNNIDIHMEGFNSFLSEAIEFYKKLIIKIRKCCVLPKETFSKKGGGSNSVEIAKLHKFRYAHHRFLVCLGDLARYRELCKKPDNRKWSVVATYYLEATMVCPESGNPQNQLALLATYVGDDFLALYHCVRSLAVKEPFPDAGDNLVLLFEKNRSSHLPSLSSEAHFDFTKPSERSCLWTNSQGNRNSLNILKMESTELSSGKTDLWPLFVRMISFFFIESSLEDFPCTFASTMRELESLLALDDIKLKTSLESYEHMDSARRGPYRALQIVSTLIFIIHNLAENPESNNQKEKIHLALNATFICMGRLLERCNNLDSCRLLGAVLVFIEWLVVILDRAEKYGADEKVGSAILYFFGAFADLLNLLDLKDAEVDNNAIWEDYELRGFVPISHSHNSLDFSTHLEYVENYDSGNECRAHRLFLAAMKIVEKSQKWISYDKLREKFYAKESKNIVDERAEASSSLEVKDRYQHKCGPGKEHENDNPEESQAQPCAKGESVTIEEEEVILFRPITRYNSAPIFADEMCGENSREQTAPSDECLRRASSLFDAQNRARPSNPFKQPEYPPAGPPSLSAWVVNRESLNIGKGSTRDFTKHELSPIQEIAPQSFTSLSISDSLNGSGHISGPTHDSSSYVAPVPSAPLLPEDAVWFRGNSPNFKEADGILGASPLGGYPHRLANPGPLDYSPGLPGFIDGYLPFSGMSSSEWLYNYQNSHNLERGGNHVWPAHLNPLGNFNGHDTPRFDVFNRTVYMEGPQLYPGPSPYGCGAGTEVRVEQPPLLQYLKEREWQLQRERGPHYMGN
ncbi:hypothetical protein LguiB_034070 [Lonicera macranthoides]